MKKSKKIAFLLALAMTMQPVATAGLGFGGSLKVYAASEEADFVFDSNSGYITGYKGTASDLIIPETINGIKVKGIGPQAFSSKKTGVRLTSVTFSEGLETIEQGAFINNDLTTIKLPNSLKVVGRMAFSANKKLESVEFNEGLERIDQQAFLNDLNLKGEVILPSGLSHLFTSAFKSTGVESLRVRGDENSQSLILHSGLGDSLAKVSLENPKKPISINFNSFSQNALIEAGELSLRAKTEEELKALIEENINIEFIGTYVNKADSTGLNDKNISLDTSWDLSNFTPNGSFDITGKMAIDPQMELPTYEGYTSPNLANQTGEISITLRINNSTGEDLSFKGEDFEYGTFTFKGSMQTQKTLFGIVGLSEEGKEKLSKNPDLVIPTSIEKDGEVTPIRGIGRSAFKDQAIRTLSFGDLDPKGTFVIMDSAFQNTGLEEINLKEGIKTIESYAFNGNKLKDVYIPGSIVKIGSEAFRNNLIENLTISDDVVEIQIDNYSFAENKLSLVKLPYSVFKIRDNVFMKNTGYDNSSVVRLETRNPGHLTASTYIVPKSDYHEIVLVTDTNRQPLFDQIKIANSIHRTDYKEADLQAFDEVLSEVKAVFSDEKSSQEDLDSAYDRLVEAIAKLRSSSSDKTKLRDLVVKAKELNKDLFTEDSYQKLLTEIEEAEKVLGKDAGQDEVDSQIAALQKAMDDLVIGENSRYTADDFTYEGNVITGFSQSGLEKYAVNKDLVLPDQSPDGLAIEGIGKEAFHQKDGVIYGSDVVESPLGLKSVSLPKGLKRIENNAFQTNNLKVIDFPETLEYVGDSAFNGNQIEKVYLPDSVKEIGTGSFSLNQIVDLRISPNMKAIPDGAFSRNIKISKLDIPEGIEFIGQAAFMGSPLKEISFPTSLKEIDRQAFASHRLESLTIPGNVKKIGSNAFDHNKKFLYLKELVLEEGVEEIGSKAFGNSLLKETKLPKSLKVLASDAFAGAKDADNKQALVVKLYTENPDHLAFNTEEALANQEVILLENEYTADDFTYKLATVTGFSESGLKKFENNKDLVLPDKTPEGRTIIKVGDSAFMNKKLNSVKIPDTVIKVESFAFYNTGLSQVDLPEAVKSMGISAFANNQIKTLTIGPNLKEIPNGAFANNPIESLSISEGVEVIGQSAFIANNLRELELPGSVKTIGRMAFKSGSTPATGKMEKLTLNEGLESIDKDAFQNLLLTEVNIPSSLTAIKDTAFRGNIGFEESGIVNLYTENKDHLNFNSETSLKNQKFIFTGEEETKDFFVRVYVDGRVVKIKNLGIDLSEEEVNQLSQPIAQSYKGESTELVKTELKDTTISYYYESVKEEVKTQRWFARVYVNGKVKKIKNLGEDISQDAAEKEGEKVKATYEDKGYSLSDTKVSDGYISYYFEDVN